MWYYDSQIIRTPKAMVIGSGDAAITHPKGIFNNSATLTELGIKPYTETESAPRYYTRGAYSVDTSGDTVEGTYAGTAKPLADIRAMMLTELKEAIDSRMSRIDWYWVRASKSGGTAVPSAIATYSAALYTEYAAKKTEIAALDTLAKVIEYENRAYTQVDKVKTLNADGSFKEYHASDTTSIAREIKMVRHYTTHPDDVDAGLVSLTAD